VGQVLAADLAQRAGKAGDANWTSRAQGAIMVSFMNYKELRQGYVVRACTKRPAAAAAAAAAHRPPPLLGRRGAAAPPEITADSAA
jgi:hypothetical protein